MPCLLCFKAVLYCRRCAEDVRWDKVDMSYLQRDNYARLFAAELAAAAPLESVGASCIHCSCMLLLPARHAFGLTGVVTASHPDCSFCSPFRLLCTCRRRAQGGPRTRLCAALHLAAAL